MPKRADRREADRWYSLRFLGAITLLWSATLVLVLFVLPQRYVLSSGFREANLNFPSPTAPFSPEETRIVTARPLPSPPDEEVVQGPAERFWATVMPLLEAERYREAIELFIAYLSEYPGDLDVRREYAITLTKAGFPERAIPMLERLLALGGDDELRLLLARTLRDAGRVSDASVHYAALVDSRPADVDLMLEWARALAWAEDYGAAEAVLRAALERAPNDGRLVVELARVHYSTGRLVEADRLLAGLSEAELERLGATRLRDDVRAALTPPDEPPRADDPPPAPSLLEQAIAAREEGDFERADALFRTAIDERPTDEAVWRAYADFLQYAAEDFDGALEALKEVERLSERTDVDLQYRMALLEIWTGELDDARRRLEAILVELDRVEQAGVVPDPATSGGTPGVTRADVHARLGELARWSGNRVEAAEHYEQALAEDPDHAEANEGLEVMRADVGRMIEAVEQPRVGALARSFFDSDEYRRVDLGGESFDTRNGWIWGGRAGARLARGMGLDGSIGDRRGLFVDVEGARWWRWGTIRTAARVGAQTLASNSADPAIEASTRFGQSGTRLDVTVGHEPAYMSTNTLQAALADVSEDRLSVALTRPLGDGWAAEVTGEAASLDHDGFGGVDRTLRLRGGVSVGRAVSQSVAIGVAARALRYGDAAPTATTAIPGSVLPLYWDPNRSVSLGPYAQFVRTIAPRWELGARINPGVAFIDERRAEGGETVPDLSGTLRLTRGGARFQSTLDFSYGQGRFSGYRSYTINLSFTALGGIGGQR